MTSRVCNGDTFIGILLALSSICVTAFLFRLKIPVIKFLLHVWGKHPGKQFLNYKILIIQICVHLRSTTQRKHSARGKNGAETIDTLPCYLMDHLKLLQSLLYMLHLAIVISKYSVLKLLIESKIMKFFNCKTNVLFTHPPTHLLTHSLTRSLTNLWSIASAVWYNSISNTVTNICGNNSYINIRWRRFYN